MHAPCVHHATHHATRAVHPPCIRRHAPRARTAQVADKGTITTAGGASFAVRDVKKFQP